MFIILFFLWTNSTIDIEFQLISITKFKVFCDKTIRLNEISFDAYSLEETWKSTWKSPRSK